MKNKLKLLQELNKTRLSEIRELREITKEQSHRDFYDGQIAELKRSINHLEDIINTQERNMCTIAKPPLDGCSSLVQNGITNLTGSALSGPHF